MNGEIIISMDGQGLGKTYSSQQRYLWKTYRIEFLNGPRFNSTGFSSGILLNTLSVKKVFKK